jgi:putative ABC transport system ATP-binding protein
VKSEGVAVIAVTHDPLVEEYADRVVDLTDGVLTGGLPTDGLPADELPADGLPESETGDAR